jgi:hypothetical protein
MTTSRKRSPKHLSDTALVLLGRAADRDDSMLLPYPESLKTRGQALAKVLNSLLAQGLVEEVPVGIDEEAWRSDDDGRYGLGITPAGLKAIGVPAQASGLESEPAGTAAGPTATPEPKPTAAPRPGSKQAQLIAMLMQPDGKSIDELSQALGWLPHTTRAVISGLRKSGHVVSRAKSDDGQSLYRIEAPAEATASDPDA